MNALAKRITDAECYTQADKSDPFTTARIACHMRNGVAGFTSQGGDAFYCAAPYQEEHRLPDTANKPGESYFVTVYKNMVRP